MSKQIGYIKDYRKELDSDIWLMPPLYHRVWHYLKLMVNHEAVIFPMNDGTKIEILAGQHLTSIRNICKGVSWYEGVTYKEPNPKTIRSILEWFKKKNMVEVNNGRGNRQYTLITLLNWDLYQRNDDRGNVKVTPKKQMADINKNDKNIKNNNMCVSSEKVPVENNYSDDFEMFWKIYPRNVDKKKSFLKFNLALKKYPLETILKGTNGYAAYIKKNNTETKYIKHPSTFLNNESYLDEYGMGGEIKTSTLKDSVYSMREAED